MRKNVFLPKLPQETSGHEYYNGVNMILKESNVHKEYVQSLAVLILQLGRCQTPFSKINASRILSMYYNASRETCAKHYLSGFQLAECWPQSLTAHVWVIPFCRETLRPVHARFNELKNWCLLQSQANSYSMVEFDTFWSRRTEKAPIPPSQSHHNAPSCCSAPVTPFGTWLASACSQDLEPNHMQLRISADF